MKNLAVKAVRAAAIASFASLALVALGDMLLSRLFFRGIPGAGRLIEVALLAVAFFSAALATIEGKHLALTGQNVRHDRIGLAVDCSASFLNGLVDTLFFWASLSLLFIGFEPGDRLLGLPIAVFVSPMPIGFLVMIGANLARGKAPRRLAFAIGILAGVFLALPAIGNLWWAFGNAPAWLQSAIGSSYAASGAIAWPLIAILAVGAFTGLPLYALISGAAALLFLRAGSAIELIPSEAFSLLRNSSMPAIPLFTIAGFMLSESGSGKRLVSVFRHWFGWIPGGEALASVLVCAFFTTFTGANGVTILALGGILAYVLTNTGAYTETYARGLLTASSSVGLLFPPSLAIILYAINAQFLAQADTEIFTITDMFLGALIPGAILTLSMGGAGVIKGLRSPGSRSRFDGKAALLSLKDAAPELAVPLIIALLYFTGLASITEIGSIVVAYLAVTGFFLRGGGGLKALMGAVRKALPVAGGALIVIAAARGLSFYIMDAGIPELFGQWMQATVGSKALFLLVLNLSLLLVGCLMDIFSAVLVISPLVIPLAAAYGVHPVHLGVIFIMNLSIGFLTPPIGMNLFLASYAFDKPVMRLYRDVLPFFLIQLGVLALVTWVPWLSTALLPR